MSVLETLSVCQNATSVVPEDERKAESEKPTKRSAPGFAHFAEFLASDPDLQIYRKFATLASRNLAYLQSELLSLNDEIEALDDFDRQEAAARSEGWVESQLPARCWELFERKCDEGSEREVRRMQLVKRLRSLTAEYQDALIRQSRILQLDSAPARSRKALSGWFQQNRPLVGHSYDLVSAEHDLVVLRTPPDQDRLTTFIQNHLGYYLRSQHHERYTCDEVKYFPEETIRHIVSVLSVILSAVLLVGAIVALYYAHSKGAKLGLIAVVTILFAASVGLLTNARKPEVYASTAAYAAVLVVYVSNDPTNCST